MHNPRSTFDTWPKRAGATAVSALRVRGPGTVADRAVTSRPRRLSMSGSNRPAFTEQMSTYADALAQAATDPDPWQAFTNPIETVCRLETVRRLQREERGLPAASADTPAALHVREPANFQQDITVLMRRAQAAGALRPTCTRPTWR